MGRKVSFAVVLTDITRKGSLSEEGSIHTAEMTTIKVALKEIHKREDKRSHCACRVPAYMGIKGKKQIKQQ